MPQSPLALEGRRIELPALVSPLIRTLPAWVLPGWIVPIQVRPTWSVPDWQEDPWSVLLLVAAIWVATSVAVSLLGWARVAEQYAWDGALPSRRFRFRSAGFRRGAGYNFGVNFAVDDEALYVWVLPFLRIGHSPLRIPWSDIEPHAVRAGLVRRVDLELARVPRTALRITPRLARDLEHAAGGSWPVPAARQGTS